MNVSANGKLMVTATKDLARKWEETRQTWRDSKAQEFEQKYLFELLGGIDRAAPVFEKLEKLLTRIRNDCE